MDMRVYVGRAFGSFLFVVAAGIVPAFAQAAQRADVGLSYQFVRFLGDFE